MTQKTTPFDHVRNFMIAGDHSIDGSNTAQSDLYVKLVAEEYAEFIHALMDKDDVALIDSCCDMIWVITGYALSRGWDISGAYSEVARSNMSKVDSASGKLIKREDGKVLKPATYSAPELSPYVRKVSELPNYEFMRMGE
jgi:predicted HAD superfamily Cof-like phosphohydrolase